MPGGWPGCAKVVIRCGFWRYRALGMSLRRFLMGICGVAAQAPPNASGGLVNHRYGFCAAIFFQFPQHAARGGVLGQALAADEKVPFKAPGTFGITIGLPRSCLAPDCAQLGRLFSDVCAGGPLGPQFVGNRVSMT